MNRIKQTIDAILKPSEQCIFVTEVWENKPKEAKKKIVLAIVQHVHKRQEIAIMFLVPEHILSATPQDKQNTKFKVAGMYPIQNDFGMKIIAERQFDLFFRTYAKLFNLETTTTSALWSLASVVTKASKAFAESIGTTQEESVKTHSWLQPYLDTVVNHVISTNSEDGENNGLPIVASSSNLAPQKQELFSNSIKEDWIAMQLKSKASEFTEIMPMKVVVGTWNVNSKFPQSQNYSFSNWFHVEEFGEADIYVLGFQEIDMTAGALLREETEVGSAWTSLLSNYFKTLKNKYYLLMSRQLVGILTCVFVQEKHMSCIKDVRACTEGVGIMGMMGNKGGVGVRLQLHESTLCFLNTHLAPHKGAVSKRNQNFHDLVKRVDFDGGSNYNVEKHDHFIWLGDLNYRIEMEDEECKKLIQNKDFDALMKHDQLSVERAAQRVFKGYDEGKIAFAPTYKFDPGTDIYDTSEKKRTPAYTDRVLWRKRPKNDEIRQIFYTMHPEYLISDHKPVVAGFEIDVKKIIENKYKQCYRDLIKMLDKLENDMLPEIKLAKRDFIFTDVKYGNSYSETMTIENIGQVVCEFVFVPKPGEQHVAKNWLTIEPSAGIIIPGETADITLTVRVDADSAPKLNMKKENIDDILILHLKNGRDHFVSVQGNYIPSCYGSDLTLLASLTSPVRTAVVETPVETSPRSPEAESTESKNTALKIPKELFRMIDFLATHGLREPGLFKEAGDSTEVDIIREKLDTGESFENFNGSIHSMTEALITFLESLAEPLIPSKFYRACIKGAEDMYVCKHILSKLPTVHYNCFHYLMSFLREVLEHSKYNGLTLDELAIIFSRSVLVPPDPGHSLREIPAQKTDHNEQRSKVAFLKHFLTPHLWPKQEVYREN